MKKTIFATMIAILFAGCGNAQKVDNTPIAALDLNKYLGDWYEIARFDHSFERGLEFCKANYALREDGKIEVKPGKRLTTESRVLALIRIGITDNQSIANILRASLTTIYTYRSKLKARAIDKDGFEASVQAIDC